MFDLKQFRDLARRGDKTGFSVAEQSLIFKSLASVTDEELADFIATFPPLEPSKEEKEAEKAAAKAKDEKTARASKEIAAEKKEKPDLHLPRNKDGSIKKSSEAAREEAAREGLPSPNPNLQKK